MKTCHNFLGSGCPIRYRGIFSGLSNETMGAASCFIIPFIPPMDTETQQLLKILFSYQGLLYRFACIRTRNKLVAALIVEEVIALPVAQIKILPPQDVRKFLANCTSECCDQWMEAKGRTLYQRKPKNPT